MTKIQLPSSGVSVKTATTINHNDLQNLNAEGHTIGAFPSSELNQPAKLLKLNTNFAEINTAQIPPYLRKLLDIPQFQTWMKNRAGHLPDVTITGAVGEDSCLTLTFDGTHIWAGLATTPFKILKINPVDNSYTVITGATGENRCRGIAFDGINIWVSLYTSPAKVMKINPSDNSYTIITASSGLDYARPVIFDGTHVWVGLDTDHTIEPKILKINPADNSYTVIYTGENYCQALGFDGVYIWSGSDSFPNTLRKIDPSDNSITIISTPDLTGSVRSLVFDGTYMWACYDYSATLIAKINPVDNNYTVITTPASEANEALIFDGTYLWIGTHTQPAQIIKKFIYLRKFDVCSDYVKNLLVNIVPTVSGIWTTALSDLSNITNGDLSSASTTGIVTADEVGAITFDLGVGRIPGVLSMILECNMSANVELGVVSVYISEDNADWKQVRLTFVDAQPNIYFKGTTPQKVSLSIPIPISQALSGQQYGKGLVRYIKLQFESDVSESISVKIYEVCFTALGY